MATLTVAQALATNASGLTVADTAANIAANLANASLVPRVSLFELSASGAVLAGQAKALVGLGSRFSTNGFRLTVRDSVAQLTAAGNAAALTIPGEIVSVSDSASNILAAIGNPIIRNAGSIVLTVNATLTLAQLLTLETWSNFTAPSLTLTLADSAANLLALTPAQAKASLTVFQMTVSSTVSAAQAIALLALPHFSIGSAAALTIADSIANISGAVGSIGSLLSNPATSVNFSDTLTNVLARAASFQWLSYPHPSITLTVGGTITVAQAATLAALPNMHVGTGQSLTIADTAANLLGLNATQAALAQSTALTVNDNVNSTQLKALAALHGFSHGTHTLTVTDNIANLSSLNATQRAAASSETVVDAVQSMLSVLASGSPVLSFVNVMIADLDGKALTAAQATSLVNLAAHATLVLTPSNGHNTLTVSDTAQNLSAASASLAALQADGPVTIVTTGSSDRAILTAAEAAALVQANVNPASSTLAVADTGSALAAVASQLFGHGFEAITVTSGVFSGTLAQLLDPTLHFLAGSTALLNANATPSVAQATSLAALPGFGRANSVTVTVQDHIANLIAAAGVLPSAATSVGATDSATVSAANATTLAQLQAAVGAANFSLGGNTLTIGDTAQDILAQASVGAIALAGAIHLTGDARINAASAAQLVALGAKFSPNGFFVEIADSAANLASLTTSQATLTAINDWNGEAVLSANATGVSVAAAGTLLTLAGFNVGTHTLGISDTAANLLLGSNAAAVALATSVQLSQASTVTAANAASLAALRNFSAGGLLMISDTPVHLLGMTAAVATLSGNTTLAALTGGNSADFHLSAALFGSMMALPHFTLAGFTGGQVTITDTDIALVALATTLGALSVNDRAHVATVLSGTGNASISVAQYQALLGLPNFSGSAGSLSVADTAANLLGLIGGSTSLLLGTVVQIGGNPITAANAQALTTLPNLQTGGAALAISDTTANVLHITGIGSVPDDWAGELLAQSITLTGPDPTVTAAQAALLAQLGFRLHVGDLRITIQDTPTALLGIVNGIGPIASQIFATALAPTGTNGVTWSLSLSQAAQLGAMPNFGVGTSGVTIADSVANLAAAANATLIANIVAANAGVTFILAGNDTATVAQVQALHTQLGNAFSHGSATLTIIDGAGHLAALDAASAQLATAIQLQGSTITSVANYQRIAALPNYSNGLSNGNPNLLVVSDTAAHLLTLIGGSNNLSFASEIMLSTSATNQSAAVAEQLATLPNFTTGIAQLTISDTAADLVHVTGAGPLPDDWTGEQASSSVTLSANGQVTAAQATLLTMLGSHFHLGGRTLTVADSAANILSNANVDGLALAGAIALTGDEQLTVAQAAQLAALPGFTKAGFHITISDSADNIGFQGNAAGVAQADHVQMAAASQLTVALAKAVIGLANFQINGSAPIAIADTLANLLSLGSTTLANNNSLLRATPIGLSADAVASVAQMQALMSLAQYGATFDRHGFSITVQDSGQNLAGFTPDGIAVPGGYTMIGDATLSAAQADHLAALGVVRNGYHLTVADTPAALLDSADNASGLALATLITLSGPASVNATDAAALVGLAGFSTLGQGFTVTDSAAALLGLDAATLLAATTLSLADSGDVVSVANLVTLIGFGGRFSLAGHSMTVADNAANLQTLNTLDLPLVNNEVLSANASLDAAHASVLAALPNLSLGGGIILVVQDSVANLVALPNAVLAIATTEQLAPNAMVTVTAAQAAALAALPHFSTANSAQITVDDTVANLNNAGTSGWHAVATNYDVTDSFNNLVANTGTLLLTGARHVLLLGDTQLDADTFDELVAIANFTRGTYTLTVVDGPAAIAANAGNILASASAAVINATAPIDAAQAERLVPLHDAGMLRFASNVHLALLDSFANLSASNNAAGVALATGITIADVPSQLAAATLFDWHGVSPSYVMSASGSVSGSEAATLAALGGSFSTGGHTLTMADDATGVSANTAALQTLHIGAQVTDTIAGVDPHAAVLAALGSTLQAVSIIDTTAVSATAADGLAPLASLLTGNGIAVDDSASAVNANLAGLVDLGSHLVSVSVDDSAANVAAVATAIATLGTRLHVGLSDATPISLGADVAAGLVPVVARLAGGTVVNVSDTGAAIAADAANLAALGNRLGAVTLSDGTTVLAATAAALVPIDQHLGVGVLLHVVDTAAHINAVASLLATLRADGRLADVVAGSDSVANVLAEAAQLAALSTTFTIHDTAAAVSAHLDELQALSNSVVTGITLSDSGTPDITLSLAQYSSDAMALGLISSSFKYAFTDSSNAIASDLAAGGGSHILALGPAVHTITVSGGVLTLPVATLLAAGVDDGANSAATRLAGTSITVTGLTINDLSGIASLTVAPTGFGVADTGVHIANDLNTPGSSVLLANRTAITGITPTGSVTLNDTAALTAHVNDGAGSIFSKMPGATLIVIGVPLSDIATLFSQGVIPGTISVTDSAGNIGGDLSGANPLLLQHLSAITAISTAGTMTLDATHALRAGVVDGPDGSVFGRIVGAVTLDVTGATVAQLDSLHGLTTHVPDSVAVSDDHAAIASDLALGASSRLEVHALDGMLSAVAVTGGLVDLDNAARAAVAAALALLPAGSLHVTDVPVADIATMAGLAAVASFAVADTAAAIHDDLTGGTPGAELATNHLKITGVTVTGGPVVLTDAEAQAAPANGLATLSSGAVEVTGVSVGDIGTIVALGAVLSGMTVVDTAGNVQTDLIGGGAIAGNIGPIISITPDAAVTLTDAQASPLTAALAKLSTGSLIVGGATVAHAGTYGAMASLLSMTVSDTAADVMADLAAGAGSALQGFAHAGKLTGITVTDTSLTLTDAQAGLVLDALAVLHDAFGVAVTAVPVADIATIGALSVVTAMTVSGTAAQLHDDLVLSNGSALYTDRAKITAVTVSDSNLVVIGSTELADVQAAALGRLPANSLVLDGVSVGSVATFAALPGLDHMTVADSGAHIAADLNTPGSSVLIANRGSITGITPNRPITLTDAAALTAHVNDGAGSVFSKMPGATLLVTGVPVSDIPALFGVGVAPAGIVVSDVAANIEADLIAGGSSHILARLGAINGLSASDSGTITLTVAQVTAAGVDDGAASALAKMSDETLLVTGVTVAQIAAVLSLGVAPSSITVDDTAAHIQADLAAGGSSGILSNLPTISHITVGDSGMITLTAAQVTAAGVDDGPGSALAKMSGETLEVTGVAAAQIGGVFLLGVTPASITVSDTAAQLQADLIAGGGSGILSNLAAISHITANDGGTITLSEAQLIAAGVDDGAGSALAKLSGETLAVTGVTMGQIGTVLGLGVVPDHIALRDAAATIESELVTDGAASPLVTHVGLVSGISYSAGSVVTLTDTQAVPVLAMLAKLPGAGLVITGVSVANVTSRVGIASLDHVTVSDSAAHIQADLTAGGASHILPNLPAIGGIVVNDAGTITLTEAQALAANAAGALAELSLAGGSLVVTGVPVADIGAILALPHVTSVEVSDLAATIQADLIGGGVIAGNIAAITSQAVSDALPVSLSVGEIQAANVDSAVGVLVAHGSSVIVTPALVGDLATIDGLSFQPSSVVVVDSAAHVQSDLDLAGSVLQAHRLLIGSIQLNDGGTPTIALSMARLTANNAALSLVSTPYDLAISDSAAAIQNDLNLGSSSFLLAHLAALSGITVNDAGTITLTAAAALTTGIDDNGSSVFARMSGFDHLAVTGAGVNQIAAIAVLATPPTHVTVSDTAVHIQDDLNLGAGTSAIRLHLGVLDSITASGGTVHVTETTALAPGVADDGTTSVMAKLVGQNYVVTGVAVAGIGSVLGLTVPPASIEVGDTAAHIQGDLAGAATLLVNNAAIGAITVTGGGTITLTAAQLTTPGVDDSSTSVLGKTTGYDHLAVTSVALAGIAALVGLYQVPDQISILDAAATLQSDLTGASEILANISHINAISLTDAGPIGLTAAEATTASAALGKLDAGTLAITGVAVAEVNTFAALAALTSMNVSDLTAAIQADLNQGAGSHLVLHAAQIGGIGLSDGGPVSLDDTHAQAALAALAKLAAGTLTVTGVTLQHVNAMFVLAAITAGTGMTVADTAANIQGDLVPSGGSKLLADLAKITGIARSDAAFVTLDVADAAAVSTVLAKLAAGSLDVTGVALADVATVTAYTALHRMAVSDSTANLHADLILGNASALRTNAASIGTISLSDSGPIGLTDAQAELVLAALAKLDAGTLTVTAVSVADIAAIAALTALTGMTVNDTATNLHDDLVHGATSVLQQDAAKISAITVASGGPISLTDAQAEQVLTALGRLGAGTLTVTGVSVTDVATIAGLAAVTPGTGMTVSDTAAHLHDDLVLGAGASTLFLDRAKIGGIAVASGGPISLADSQAQPVLAALAKFGAGSLAVTGAPVADIASLAALTGLTTMTVADTASAITTDLGLGGGSAIRTGHAQIAALTVIDGSIDSATAVTIYGALQALAPPIAFDEGALTISDSAANLVAVHGSTPAVLAAALHVTLSGDATAGGAMTAADATILAAVLTGGRGGHLVAIVDTAAHILLGANAAGISLASSVDLDAPAQMSAADATSLANLANFDRAGPAVTIVDTPTNLLSAGNANAILNVATTVKLDHNTMQDAAGIAALVVLHGFAVDGTHALGAQDNVSNILTLTGPQLGFVSSFVIVDSAASVQAQLDALQSNITALGHPLAILLSDSATRLAISVSATTYAADAATLDAISVANAVKVTGDASSVAAVAAQLAADSVVGEVDVTDSAAGILSNLTALELLGSKFVTAMITDATVNASEIAGLLTIVGPTLTATNGALTITDTGSQIAAAIQANGTAGANFLNTYNVYLSGDSVISAADALQIERLSVAKLATLKSQGPYTLQVWDTASHLIDSVDGYLAAVSNSLIDGVFLKTVGGSQVVSAATAGQLVAIPHFHANNPDNSVNTLTVQDTAAHIESSRTALLAHSDLVTGIVINASATITDAVLSDLQALGAVTTLTKANGATLTVRDTAATIVANAPGQSAGSPHPTADVWALSSSATLSEAGIAYLGSLAGFNPGAFTLTLDADTAGVSVADANLLAGMTSFRTGGHQLHVPGTVASLSGGPGLSVGAKAIVSPDITDTFANIASLALGSGLLAGITKAHVHLTVSDSFAPSAAQVSSFLNLLLVGGNGGIPVANVSFGSNVEAVTDTIANLQSFTATSAWTSNASVQTHFHLVAADTVDNLINPANTSALASYVSSTLNGNLTTTAAKAESLDGLASSINFQLGGNTLTVSDTAAHLLDPANASGLANQATAWQLSGPDTVLAGDAETLLTAAKFTVNQSLTVSDASVSLLDGALGPDIAAKTGSELANIHVVLAAPETLDALTAAALVALPKFSADSLLSIQDGSAYLLNASASAAETAAIVVTLAGDEVVSAATGASLAGLPHFILGTNHVTLAANDFASAATLNALGSLGANFQTGGHTLTMTQDATGGAAISGLTMKMVADFGGNFRLNGHSVTLGQDALALTPGEYAAAQTDGVGLNGHALSAMPDGVSVTNGGGSIHIAATGVNTSAVTLYDSSGAAVGSTTASPTFTISKLDAGASFAVTETVGGVESAPVIALEQTILTTEATNDGASFLTTGQVQVGVNQYVNLYTTATAHATPVQPELVYDSSAHTLSLDTGSHVLTLLTLGTATHPAALDPSEIFVKHFG